MAIHLALLSWALIFILRLRFPPGKSIATNFENVFKIQNIFSQNYLTCVFGNTSLSKFF